MTAALTVLRAGQRDLYLNVKTKGVMAECREPGFDTDPPQSGELTS